MKRKSDIVTLVILIILIVALIISFGYIIINGNPDNTKNEVNNIQNTSNTVKNISNNNENENKNENNVTNNTVNNTVNETVENKANNTETNDKEKNEPDKTTEEGRRKIAENLVKEKWGTEEGVYFSTDGIDTTGKYIVNVRDINSTAVHGTYLVDINASTTEEYK